MGDNNEVEAEYAGSTNQRPERRDRQHRSGSNNRGLREAIESGKRVEF